MFPTKRPNGIAQKRVTNPKRIPRTEADVQRAYSEGFQDGMRDIMDVMVYTLGAECEMSDDWLDFFHERFMKNLECHVHGELTTYDMRKTLYAEKNWRVELK